MAKYLLILMFFAISLNCNSQVIREETESLIPERKKLVKISSKFQNDTLYYFGICFRGIMHTRIIEHWRFYWIKNLKYSILPGKSCTLSSIYDKDDRWSLCHSSDNQSLCGIRSEVSQDFYDRINELEAAFNSKERNGQKVEVYKKEVYFIDNDTLETISYDRFFLYKNYIRKEVCYSDTHRWWCKYKEKDVLLIKKHLVDYMISHNIPFE